MNSQLAIGSLAVPSADPTYRQLYKWMDSQRRYYKLFQAGKPECELPFQCISNKTACFKNPECRTFILYM